MRLPISWDDLERVYKVQGVPEKAIELRRGEYTRVAIAWDNAVIAFTTALREAFRTLTTDDDKIMMEGMLLQWLQSEYNARTGMLQQLVGKHWN